MLLKFRQDKSELITISSLNPISIPNKYDIVFNYGFSYYITSYFFSFAIISFEEYYMIMKDIKMKIEFTSKYEIDI
jgi:hypothetical protein